MTILIDVHEPSTIFMGLMQSHMVRVDALNEHGDSDYKWKTTEGLTVQVERKQWGEVLSGMSKVEDQLRRHMDDRPKDKHILLIEGLCAPNGKGGIHTLRSTNRATLFSRSRDYSVRPNALHAWLYQVSKFIEIQHTASEWDSVHALSSFYAGDSKDDSEHRTFSRHYKSVTFHPNPQVTMLMGLLPGVGEKRAEALIAEYGTVWESIHADPKEIARLPGFGPSIKDILRRIGRPI